MLTHSSGGKSDCKTTSYVALERGKVVLGDNGGTPVCQADSQYMYALKRVCACACVSLTVCLLTFYWWWWVCVCLCFCATNSVCPLTQLEVLHIYVCVYVLCFVYMCV